MNLLAYIHLRNIWSSTGTGRLARNMVEQLQLAGRDHIMILADPADHAEVLPKVQAPWDKYEYRFFQHGTSRQQAIWAALDFPAAETYWPEVDVVYCPAESYVPVKRARLAVTLHDAAYFESGAHREDWATFKQRLKWRYLYHKLDRRADRLFTVSNFSAERLSHLFPPFRDRLRVVPSAVGQRFFDPVSAAGEKALDALGLRCRSFIMVPGGLQYRKNADVILQAWPILSARDPDLLLVISGPCDPVYAQKAAALGHQVRIVGFVEDELICSLYHAARVVWFPTLYEGFGLPPLEAMACGTPVVSSDRASIPEISGYAALMVSASSPEAHVEAIEAVLGDAQLAARLTAAGHHRSKEFTWAAASQKLRFELSALV